MGFGICAAIVIVVLLLFFNTNANRIRKINNIINKDRSVCDFIISLDGWNVSTTETGGLRIIITPIGMPRYSLYITYKGERPSNDNIRELHYKLTNGNSIVYKAHKMNMPLETYVKITQEASSIGIPIWAYIRMQSLFEHEREAFKNGNNRLVDDVIKNSIIKLVPKRDERWEHFVKNKIKNGELELRYRLGFPLSVLIEETSEIVNGVVAGFSCGIDWGYIIEFESEVGFNNSPLRKRHIVSEKMLDLIVTKRIKGSDTHYRF